MIHSRIVRLGVIVVAATLTAALQPAAAQESTTTTTDDTAPEVDGRYQGFGDGGGFSNLLPPGQNAGVTSKDLSLINAALAGDGEFPDHYVDQLRMYEALVHADDLTDETLDQYFKDASFGVAPDDIGRVYQPHDDVTVIRDLSFGVPHIFGVTRYATMFGQGYTTAEDRLFFMDVLRHVGRGRLAELIGYDEGFIGRDRDTVGRSPYTDADLRAQVAAIADSGPEGASILADVEAYTDGVNQFMDDLLSDPTRRPVEYELLGLDPEPWVPEDAVAIATLVGGIFGRGGGREVENACGLQRLTANLDGDTDTARRIFDDLRFVDDTRAPTTGGIPADNELGRPDDVDDAANPTIDCASLRPINDASPSADSLRAGFASSKSVLARDERWTPTVRFLESLADAAEHGAHMSNAILVAGDRAAAGRPIAVFGPQIGYSAPELLTEKDVHGPGIDARGVGFLGIDLYVLLGRGDQYAWSATSSGADNVDQVVLTLCDPDGGAPTIASSGYARGGKCVEIEQWDHVLDAPATALAPTARRVTWTVQRSEYGPLLWRGTLLDGTPIAIAERRSTYGREVASAFGFKQLNDPEFMADGVDQFRRATGEGIDYTFNWFYVDDRDIAFQDSCRCPIRAARTDPALPVAAGGEYDWSGEFLESADLPHDVNPDSGYLVSWNNRPAPGWDASDSEFSYGPVHRSLLLSRPIEALLDAAIDAETGLTRVDVVQVMRTAANQDLRAVEVLPRLLDALGEAPDTIDPRLLDLRERLEIWADAGGFRRDEDADGAYDDAVAPAVMDAWWPRILDAVFADDGDARTALGLDAGYLDDTSAPASALLSAIDGTSAHTFCRSDACGDELWAALALAEQDLRREFATPAIAEWARTPADDEIRYATLLAGMPTIHWQNRPTFQQVVQLQTERERPAPSTDPEPTSATDPPNGGDDDDDDGSTTALGIIAGAMALAAIVGGAWWRQVRRRR